MIRFVHGNLFDSQAEALVNTVNCVGIMGKGIAYQFKRAFPASSAEYAARCARREIRLGEVTASREQGRMIIQFPTKLHWKSPSKLNDVKTGLHALRQFIDSQKIRSIALPPLGCGNGGLKWGPVRELIISILDDLPQVDIEVYEPATTTDSGMLGSKVAKKPRLSLSAVVVAAVRMRLAGGSKLALQKALYFFDVYIDQPYFRFVPHHYGPWCPDVDRLVQLVRDYLDFSGVPLEHLVAHAVRQELSGADNERFHRWLHAVELATKLVNEENALIEAIATAHALLARSAPHSMDEQHLADEFFAWSPTKAEKFSHCDVSMALRLLEKHGLAKHGLLGWETRGPGRSLRFEDSGMQATAREPGSRTH
ncbi:macro domain-containing protein [Nannocystis sp. SCPEA4]|uniref:type II toxin-antitoxin system antitoxin DNA ADP-ribosyl glycohydrolase DarG n=1 Tax=Nannocystis sp. SCPEA4 TaxID=2996787 RepID=UPI002270AC1E|nr:macro domain-containing protein [Nannocystis sp. SCPEA4]MCY1058185.1 macro domain-containing protein [Nannocystis sp. SCPEA4]